MFRNSAVTTTTTQKLDDIEYSEGFTLRTFLRKTTEKRASTVEKR
jgi:hypothetical protein